MPDYHQVDLTKDLVGLDESANLVTLQGTVALIGNLRERAQMIIKSLTSVGQEKIFLLEGNMSSVW